MKNLLHAFIRKRLSAAAAVLFLLQSGTAFCGEETGGRYVSQHAEKADGFITRTLDRINAAWCGCRDEFVLAGHCVEDKPAEIGRDVSARADAAVDNAKDRISDSMRDFVDDTGDAIKNSADDAIYSAKSTAGDLSDEAAEAAEEVGEKASETADGLKKNVKKRRKEK